MNQNCRSTNQRILQLITLCKRIGNVKRRIQRHYVRCKICGKCKNVVVGIYPFHQSSPYQVANTCRNQAEGADDNDWHNTYYTIFHGLKMFLFLQNTCYRHQPFFKPLLKSTHNGIPPQMCILSKSDYKIGGILSQIIKFLTEKVNL